MLDDPRFDPVIRRYDIAGAWAWAAAVAALLLIGFVTVASWNNNIASSDLYSAPRPAAPRHRQAPRAPARHRRSRSPRRRRRAARSKSEPSPSRSGKKAPAETGRVTRE